MKEGFFLSKSQFGTLSTLAEVLLEGRASERASGSVLYHVLSLVKEHPTEIETEKEQAERDAYWDKVCERWEADRLANQPAMEGWDVVWAEAHDRLLGAQR